MRRAPDDKELRIARRLFARALEAKGGLKIHTIHGFCERLLQRFPLESQVTPHFSVLDEREQALLRRDAFDATVARAAEDSDGVLGKALAKIVGLTSGDYIREVIDTVLGKRAELARMVAYHEGRERLGRGRGARAQAPVQRGRAHGRGADRAARRCPDRRGDRRRHCRLCRVRLRGRETANAEAALRAARSSEGENRAGRARSCAS